MSAWDWALIVYISLALVTFVPVAYRIFVPIKPYEGGPGFEASKLLSDDAKDRLSDNFERMAGTLGFWKHAAAKFRIFHIYTVTWTLIASITVPVVAQSITDAEPSSKWLVTVAGLQATLLLGGSRAFKVETSWRAFREGESLYYDTRREMLDNPSDFGSTEDEQVVEYFRRTAAIRRRVRDAEIDNFPSADRAEIGGGAPPPIP